MPIPNVKAGLRGQRIYPSQWTLAMYQVKATIFLFLGRCLQAPAWIGQVRIAQDWTLRRMFLFVTVSENQQKYKKKLQD